MTVFTSIEDVPLGHYKAIAFDPPWKFSAGTKGRPQHYPRMADVEIADLPISALAHPDGAFIFVWITSPIDGPRFWEKIWPAWKRQRVKYSGRAFVWIKTHRARGNLLFVHQSSLHVGTGYTTRKNAEDALLFKVGSPRRARRDVAEVILSPLRAHSRKPEEFYERVEQLCGGPYLEFFSRQPRSGWDTFGNEPEKFTSDAA